MNVTECARVKLVAASTISRSRRDPAMSASRNRMWSIPVEQVLGAQPEELPEPLVPGLPGGEGRVVGVERGAARPAVDLVGDDRLGALDVALGVGEQPAAHLVLVAPLGAGPVEQQIGVRHALALADREVADLGRRAGRAVRR